MNVSALLTMFFVLDLIPSIFTFFWYYAHPVSHGSYSMHTCTHVPTRVDLRYVIDSTRAILRDRSRKMMTSQRQIREGAGNFFGRVSHGLMYQSQHSYDN